MADLYNGRKILHTKKGERSAKPLGHPLSVSGRLNLAGQEVTGGRYVFVKSLTEPGPACPGRLSHRTQAGRPVRSDLTYHMCLLLFMFIAIHTCSLLFV